MWCQWQIWKRIPKRGKMPSSSLNSTCLVQNIANIRGGELLKFRTIISPLTHCGLVTPYGDIDLGQHWLKKSLVAWWNQAITWANVDFLLMGFRGIHLREISHHVVMLLFCIMSFKLYFWNYGQISQGPRKEKISILPKNYSLVPWITIPFDGCRRI